LPFQPSKWVRQGTRARYGEGEVFAFENERDAIRWASKMDWAFHQTMGSGKISIIEFLRQGEWDEDPGDPLTQAASEGRWLKTYAAVKPSQIIGATKATLEVIRSLAMPAVMRGSAVDPTEAFLSPRESAGRAHKKAGAVMFMETRGKPGGTRTERRAAKAGRKRRTRGR
jgi:hypothetical protein